MVYSLYQQLLINSDELSSTVIFLCVVFVERVREQKFLLVLIRTAYLFILVPFFSEICPMCEKKSISVQSIPSNSRSISWFTRKLNVLPSTPMMDLLIQVTTAHKINPAGHIIHVVSDSRLVTYKPSTPIGVYVCVRERKCSNTRVKDYDIDNSGRHNNTRNPISFP